MDNIENKYCYICNSITEEYMVCETCDEHYCDDCSYTYSLHFQFQGGMCYECSGQTRIEPLTKEMIRENTLKKLDDIL